MHLKVPSLVRFVPMLLAKSPVFLVMGTLRDAEDRRVVATAILDYHDPVDEVLLDTVADAIVKDWLGIDRWTAVRLWTQVYSMWGDVDGELLRAGVDLSELDISRATSVVMRLLAEWNSGDKNKLEKWRRDLTATPPRAARAAANVEAAAEDWTAFAQLAKMQGKR